MAIAHKNLGNALLSMGRVEEGMKAYRWALDLDFAIFETTPQISFSTRGTDLAMQYYCFAKLCAANGKVDAAIAFLKKAQSQGFSDFARIKRDPDFKAVVSHFTDGQGATEELPGGGFDGEGNFHCFQRRRFERLCDNARA
jgi:tetratricopeptide (TPR) repeat protein